MLPYGVPPTAWHWAPGGYVPFTPFSNANALLTPVIHQRSMEASIGQPDQDSAYYSSFEQPSPSPQLQVTGVENFVSPNPSYDSQQTGGPPPGWIPGATQQLDMSASSSPRRTGIPLDIHRQYQHNAVELPFMPPVPFAKPPPYNAATTSSCSTDDSCSCCESETTTTATAPSSSGSRNSSDSRSGTESHVKHRVIRRNRRWARQSNFRRSLVDEVITETARDLELSQAEHLALKLDLFRNFIRGFDSLEGAWRNGQLDVILHPVLSEFIGRNISVAIDRVRQQPDQAPPESIQNVQGFSNGAVFVHFAVLNNSTEAFVGKVVSRSYNFFQL